MTTYPEDLDEDPPICQMCNGSGIGQQGDPDTSKCPLCHGSGVEWVIEDDGDRADHAYDLWRDRQMERDE